MRSSGRIIKLLKRLEKRAVGLSSHTFITICDTREGKNYIDYDYFTFKKTGKLVEIDTAYYKNEPSNPNIFLRMGIVDDDGKIGLGFMSPDDSFASNVVKNPKLNKQSMAKVSLQV